jgi:tetratricopeptide (TPR) repeat protein
MELTVDQALQQGVAAHKEGKLQDAERLYRAILQAQPKHPDANHNLGVLAVAVGKPLEAIPFFKLALEANPQIEQFWLSYIDALITVERFDEAKRVLVEGEKSGVSSEKLDALNSDYRGACLTIRTRPQKARRYRKREKSLLRKRKVKREKHKVIIKCGAITGSNQSPSRALSSRQIGRSRSTRHITHSTVPQTPIWMEGIGCCVSANG